MPKMPTWISPTNITKTLEDGDGFWEDERWSPIRLTAMSGTEYDERALPVAWQIEFDPSQDVFEAANARLEKMEIEPDGYGWGEYVERSIQTISPGLAKRLRTTDCEMETCVIWVESEEDGRAFFETTWKLIFEE